MAIDSATAKALKLQPGSWYSTDNKWYKYGEDRAYTMDEYKDITQPGWKEAAAQLAAAHAAEGRVLLDDGKGAKWYAPKELGTQGADGVWRPNAGVTQDSPGATYTGNYFGKAYQNGKPVTSAGAANPMSGPQAPQVQPAVTSTAPANTGAITITPRPISPEVQALLTTLRDKINAAPITADQIMASKEYQDQAKAISDMAALNVGQTTASIRRQLAARNMLRSTPAVQALTSAEGDINLKANADKAALIPTMLANAYNRQQTDLKNYADLLSTTSGLENDAFNRGLSEFQATAPYNMLTKAQQQNQANYEAEQAAAKAAAEAKAKADAEKAPYENAWKMAEQTGVYFDPVAKQLADKAVAAKEKYEKERAGGKTDAELQGLKDEANDARRQLAAMGINADALFGSGVTATDAKKNINQLGVWTLEGRKKEWEMTGVDPATGVTNPEFLLKDMQAQKAAAEAAVAQIDARIAADPEYGKTSEAISRKAKADADLRKADADIAATWALVNERNQSAKATTDKVAKDAQSEAKKTYDANVEANVKTYYVGKPAAELWEDFQTLKNEASTRQEQEAILAQMIKATPISNRDLLWLTNMWNASTSDLYRAELDAMRTDPSKE